MRPCRFPFALCMRLSIYFFFYLFCQGPLNSGVDAATTQHDPTNHENVDMCHVSPALVLHDVCVVVQLWMQPGAAYGVFSPRIHYPRVQVQMSITMGSNVRWHGGADHCSHELSINRPAIAAMAGPHVSDMHGTCLCCLFG